MSSKYLSDRGTVLHTYVFIPRRGVYKQRKFEHALYLPLSVNQALIEGIVDTSAAAEPYVNHLCISSVSIHTQYSVLVQCWY